MRSILTINGGSSSIKFAMFGIRSGAPLERILCESRVAGASDHRATAGALLDLLEARDDFGTIVAAGHRVVHGMRQTAPARVTPALLEELQRIAPLVPEHLPLEIALIEAIHRRHPALAQFACFDTAFHRHMPKVASLLPVPRRLEAGGVRRYGFHGLSCEYLMGELARRGGSATARGRVVLAHLGNGASLTAVLEGRSVDTSMGFTPAAGLMMGSRSGDLDPGLGPWLAHSEQMGAAQFQHMVNHASGLLGVSETSADMRELLALEATDPRAAEAVAMFCYQAKKWIGAYAAALGGLDTLVFSGGVGENSPLIRARICAGLEFLGIQLDEARNTQAAPVAPVISTTGGRVTVRVIRTDEERMIARSVARMLDPDATMET